jgi:hypothetical protein
VRRKVLALALGVSLAVGSNIPAQALGNDVSTKIVSIAKSTLSAKEKAAIKTQVKAYPLANALTCQGLYLKTATMAQKKLAVAKAKATCSYAKTINKNLSIKVQGTTTKTKANNGKLALKYSTPSYPTQAITLENLNIDWTARVATSKVLQHLEAQPAVKVERNVVVGPTAPSKFVNEQVSLLDRAVQTFGSEFSSSYTVVLFSEKDGAWADAKLAELGGSFPAGSIAQYLKSTYVDNTCTFGFATLDKAGLPIYFSCVNTSMAKSVASDHVAIHEYFHLVQNSLYRTYERYMPLWINEGAPTFFGFALGYGLKDRSGSNGEKFYGYAPLFDPNLTGTIDTNRIRTFLRTATAKQVSDLYLAMEKDPANRDAYNHYGMGAIAVQVLVASYGVDAYFNFLKLTAQMKWQDAFKQTYGLTTIEFYEKLVPYIHALGAKYY